MDALRYRPDIDGLRTIAVLSVMFFHLGIPGFSGGFVGVDVFFVISGFLITRLIVDEVNSTGRFSFSGFYVRRIRRLFPALFVTCLISLIAAVLLLSPEDMERFAGSALHAVLSISNFYFWEQADYFDAAAYTKPLLHTWSLSVEEQFYLIWPWALVFLLLKTWPAVLLGTILFVSLGSLAVAQMWLVADTAAAFYLLPARIVEFMIGAAVVWLIRARPGSGKLDEVLLMAGLALIVYSVITFTDETPFPGVAALVPCLGAALAIYAGRARITGFLLRSPPLVAVGRWSYSIYLVHWPLLVFYSAYTYNDATAAATTVLALLSVVLGWLQYTMIEQTFRYEGRNSLPMSKFAAIVVGLAALLIVPSAAIWNMDGWKGRIPAAIETLTNRELRKKERKTYCSSVDPEKPKDLFTCQNYRGKNRDIILRGDSHALHLVAGFSELYPDYNIFVLYLSGCVPQSGVGSFIFGLSSSDASKKCSIRNQKALAYLRSAKPSTVILSSAKRSEPEVIAPPTLDILSELTEAGHKAFVIGDFIRPGRHLLNCISVPDWVLSDEHIRNRCVGDPEKMEEELAYNEKISGLVESFINPNDLRCPGDRCVFLDGSKVLLRDEHHLSSHGAIYFISRLKDRLPIQAK